MEELEQIMRRIHVLFAKCEPYGNESDGKIIVPKKEMFRLLEKLSFCVIHMMDEYEGTVESRERGLNAYQREGERIKEAAQAGADDVYAASLIYADNMLEELHDVLADAKEELWEHYARVAGRLDSHARSLSEDQEEIKQQLTAMAQGGKYLKIIEHENKRLQQMELERTRSQEGAYGDDSDEYWEEYDGEEYEEEEYEEEGADTDTEEESMKASSESEAANDALETDVEAVKEEFESGAPTSGSGVGVDGENPALNEGAQELVPKKNRKGDVEEKEPDIGKDAVRKVLKKGNATSDALTSSVKSKEKGKAAHGQKPQKAAGKQDGKRRRSAAQHARMVPDLETEWAQEEKRPVRKIGTAIYEDVGQPYDAPVKRVSYEIKVNQAYFDQLGEGNVDLDAEYYKWKEEQEQTAATSEDEDDVTDIAVFSKTDKAEKNEKAKQSKKEKKKRGLKFGKRV